MPESQPKMIQNLFIANRGEIACRTIRTCRELGIRAVVGYSDCDALSYHVKIADEAVHLGPSPAKLSYMDIGKVVEAARRTGCEAVFPGYGFLSENADFARACREAGLIFIGPGSEVISRMGDKIATKKALADAGVPIIPGLPKMTSADQIVKFGNDAGWPVIIKAVAGGGGRGMQRVDSADQAKSALERAVSIAEKLFGNGDVYVEKYIRGARHIEFQFIADAFGRVIHLGDRECSIQRRHQKLVEEAPSSLLDERLRNEMGQVVVKAAKEIGYVTAGTLEFLVAPDLRYYAIEVNPRIQVEHTVTEMIVGLDIIRLMIRMAVGTPLRLRQEDIRISSHAIQCRVNAEDPKKDFAPSYGTVTYLRQVSGPFVRADSGIYQGCEVPPFYDSLVSKICSVGKDRPTAIERMRRALSEFTVWGIKTTIPLLEKIMVHPDFVSGRFDTDFIDDHLSELLDYTEDEDEILKISRFIAEITALGKNPYCR
ncbi:MAG TPA: biotin carboxylase N-terminal domain-containing protein [Nitrospiria bacterium]|nr:biotin carboxylase N-terminal domain-containing protein [Nitrospiria bacterium]